MSAGVTVVPYRPEHLAAVSAIERACFSDPWSERSFEEFAAGGASVFYVALSDAGEAIGYLCLYRVLDEGQILNVAVRPDSRRQGAASALMTAVLGDAAAFGLSFLTLEVRASNEAARRLYEKNGFYPVGIRRAYYRDPTEDAILMNRDIEH